MSLTAIRPYFRARMNALNYNEWRDGFNFNNIPSTVLNLSYHIETISGNGVSFNQLDQVINQDVTIRVFFKGYRKPQDAIDSAMNAYSDILDACLDPANRLNQSFKNILFTSMQMDPLADTNDNAVILSLTFTVLVILAPGH